MVAPMTTEVADQAQAIARTVTDTANTVRLDRTMSDEGRLKAVAVAWTRADEQLTALKERFEGGAERTAVDLNRELFGSVSALGADAISARDADERASQLETPQEARELLTRAEANGDEVLVRLSPFVPTVKPLCSSEAAGSWYSTTTPRPIPARPRRSPSSPTSSGRAPSANIQNTGVLLPRQAQRDRRAVGLPHPRHRGGVSHECRQAGVGSLRLATRVRFRRGALATSVASLARPVAVAASSSRSRRPRRASTACQMAAIAATSVPKPRSQSRPRVPDGATTVIGVGFVGTSASVFSGSDRAVTEASGLRGAAVTVTVTVAGGGTGGGSVRNGPGVTPVGNRVGRSGFRYTVDVLGFRPCSTDGSRSTFQSLCDNTKATPNSTEIPASTTTRAHAEPPEVRPIGEVATRSVKHRQMPMSVESVPLPPAGTWGDGLVADRAQAGARRPGEVCLSPPRPRPWVRRFSIFRTNQPQRGAV